MGVAFILKTLKESFYWLISLYVLCEGVCTELDRTGSSWFIKGGTVLSHRHILSLAGPWTQMAPILVLVLHKDYSAKEL